MPCRLDVNAQLAVMAVPSTPSTRKPEVGFIPKFEDAILMTLEP
jgi:hypothetical protein